MLKLFATPSVVTVVLTFGIGVVLMLLKPRLMIFFFVKPGLPEPEPSAETSAEPEPEPEYAADASDALGDINDAVGGYLSVAGIAFGLSVQQYFDACIARRETVRQQITGDVALLQRALTLCRRLPASSESQIAVIVSCVATLARGLAIELEEAASGGPVSRARERDADIDGLDAALVAASTESYTPFRPGTRRIRRRASAGRSAPPT